MVYPKINWELCQVCNPCQAQKVCKTRAIVQVDLDEPPVVESDRCNRCAICVLACSFGAISLSNSGILVGNKFNNPLTK